MFWDTVGQVFTGELAALINARKQIRTLERSPGQEEREDPEALPMHHNTLGPAGAAVCGKGAAYIKVKPIIGRFASVLWVLGVHGVN